MEISMPVLTALATIASDLKLGKDYQTEILHVFAPTRDGVLKAEVATGLLDTKQHRVFLVDGTGLFYEITNETIVGVFPGQYLVRWYDTSPEKIEVTEVRSEIDG